jgi:hypothetical protein
MFAFNIIRLHDDDDDDVFRLPPQSIMVRFIFQSLRGKARKHTAVPCMLTWPFDIFSFAVLGSEVGIEQFFPLFSSGEAPMSGSQPVDASKAECQRLAVYTARERGRSIRIRF